MELTYSLSNFITELTGHYHIEEKAVNIFKVLQYFTEHGKKYLASSAKFVVDIFERYNDIYSKRLEEFTYKNEFDLIMTRAYTIAGNILSPRVDLNHFVLSALTLGVQQKLFPEELFNETSAALNERGAINQILDQKELDVFDKAAKSRKTYKHSNPFDLEHELLDKVYLNKDFTKEISNFLILKSLNLDLKPYLPNGIFLFIGNKSTGKSEMAYSIAETYYGSREAISEMELSMMADTEMFDRESKSEEGRPPLDPQVDIFFQMTGKDKRKVFLIKHMEFISKPLFFLLTSIFSRGYVFFEGKKIGYENSIFILTIDKSILSTLTKKIGFQNPDEDNNDLAIKELIAKEYGEEFISLFNGIYVFSDISIEDYKAIFKTKLSYLKEIVKSKGYNLTCSQEVIEHLAQEYYKQTKKIPNQISSFIEREIMVPFVNRLKEAPKKRTFKVVMKEGLLVIE